MSGGRSAARRPPAATRNEGVPSAAAKPLIRVLLVDDHPIWRETLTRMLSHRRVGEVVGEAADGDTAVELADLMAPDVVLMDIDLPELDGITATARIFSAQPSVRVLILSASDEAAQVLRALRAGARGYVCKTAPTAAIVEAVQRVHAGELVVPQGLSDYVLTELRNGAGAPQVTSALVVAQTPLRRDGLAHVLREAGLDAVSGEISALAHLGDSAHDVVVFDCTHPGEVSAAAALARTDPQQAVFLLLSAEVPASELIDYLDARPGSRGIGCAWAEQFRSTAELADAVRRVAAGEPVLDPAVVRLVLHPAEDTDELSALTDGERAVLALIADGRSNAAIARALHLSSKTVEARVSSVFTKLGLEPGPDDHRRVLAALVYLRAR